MERLRISFYGQRADNETIWSEMEPFENQFLCAGLMQGFVRICSDFAATG